jgi:hypothetical protein
MSDVSYDDVDLVEIDKIINFCFLLDVLPSYLLRPRPIIVDEPRLVLEGSGPNAQMVPVDRIFIARRIRDRFGPAVAGACMDNHPIFRMH